MSKKFDVVIGNPPYQEDAQGGGGTQMPIFHLFMDAAYEVGKKTVLITPARFLFHAGHTPKAWNAKMLNDPHLTVPYYSPKSGDVFPGTDIKGGIVITYRDEERAVEPVGTFTKYPELNKILHKVIESGAESLENAGMTSTRSYGYAEKAYQSHPDALALRPEGDEAIIRTNTFEQLSFLYHDAEPIDGGSYTRVEGRIKNQRASRWIPSDYITGPSSYANYKVSLPRANGSGQLGETLSSPIVLGPNVAVTQTFLTIGNFATRIEAEACLRYVKSKFARTMLGVLKITQHNPAKVWEYVPLQDFTSASDIDWSRSIPEIDKQLYAKYELDADEIAFIESHVKPME
jgi:hypothetical protein